MKNVCTTNCLTRNATKMATPSRIGSSFQNEPLLLLVCSSITHGAYAANLRTTITGDVSYTGEPYPCWAARPLGDPYASSGLLSMYLCTPAAPEHPGQENESAAGRHSVEDVLAGQRAPARERRGDHHRLADHVVDGDRPLAAGVLRDAPVVAEHEQHA